MAEADPKVLEAIAFFEQMLQTMPLDRTSLEFLSVAYEQTGQDQKRRECLVRLADCLLAERDYENAQIIAARLSAYRDDAQARAAAERVAEAIQGQVLGEIPVYERQVAGGLSEGSEAQQGELGRDAALEVHAVSRSASAAEMDLVWYWIEHGLLPKDVGMDVLHTLTERPVTDAPVLISAFALLDEMHPELTDGLLEAMQRVAEVPALPLELFELQPQALQALPSHYIHVKGVLPFALMANELLCAVLNPLNAALRAETVRTAGRPCHFFLAHPRVWQQAARNVP